MALPGSTDGRHRATSRKIRQTLDALRLEQMAVVVACDDLETGADREPDQWNERIPESHPIHIDSASTDDDVADPAVTRDEAVEDRDVDPAGDRNGLPRRAAARLLRRRVDVSPNEPAPEPPGPDFVDCSARTTTA